MTDFIEVPVMQSNDPGDSLDLFVRFNNITYFEPCHDDPDFSRTRLHLCGGESIVIDIDFDEFRKLTIGDIYDSIGC